MERRTSFEEPEANTQQIPLLPLPNPPRPTSRSSEVSAHSSLQRAPTLSGDSASDVTRSTDGEMQSVRGLAYIATGDNEQVANEQSGSIQHLLQPYSERNCSESGHESVHSPSIVPRTTANSDREGLELNGSREGVTEPAKHHPDWQPYALRWQFLAMLTTYTVALLLTVVALCWYSTIHHGLGNDDGSSIVLFGWRFTPSLFAVIYVQMTAMLLDEVKRTEPFARMARPGGASASLTILQVPGAWWNALSDGLSLKKNSGRRSWVLLSSALVNVIGFLTISPLSASLLESTNVAIPRSMDFFRLVPRKNPPLSLSTDIDTPMPLSIDRETYLRILGNILQNVSTSAWISDDYTIFPTWPSHLVDIPLGPLLSSTPQTWDAESLVLSTELDCQSMSLVGKTWTIGSNVQADSKGDASRDPYLNGSIVLGSEDGCSWGIEFKNMKEVRGGSFWSQLSQTRTPYWNTFDESGDKKANHSEACGNRELIVMSTQWRLTDDPNRPPDFNITGQVCTPRHYVAKIPVKVVLADFSSQVSFNTNQYLEKRTEIPTELFDVNDMQKITLEGNWSTHITIISEEKSRPTLNDSSLLLAAQLNFDMSAMTEADDIVPRAARIKQRIFGEVLQYSLLQADASDRVYIKGITTTDERRIIVIIGVATALIALLTTSLCLILLVWTASRYHLRALNLTQDPATTTAIASLVTSEARTRAGLSILRAASNCKDYRTLHQKRYFTTRQALHELGSEGNAGNERKQLKTAVNGDWRPLVLRLRTLVGLLLLQVSILICVTILYYFARTSQLYQDVFVYQINITMFTRDLPTIAPFSILPTCLAVGVSLWWSAMDATCRRLQPYLSMAEERTDLVHGAMLSYQSSYWIVAAIRAASNQHWLLCLITIGTSLSPVFTIAMSALFQSTQGIVIQDIAVERALEIRHVPLVFQRGNQYLQSDEDPVSTTVINLYTNLSTNWLYTSTIQLALNGTQPAWSCDGWSFVPLNTTSLANTGLIQHITNSSSIPPTNITVTTPAIRGRIDCSPYENIYRNISAWLAILQWTDSKANAEGVAIGYELGTSPVNGTRHFLDTTISSTSDGMACCANTTDGTISGSAIGHWSSSTEQPWSEQVGPINISTKWIYGRARFEYYKKYYDEAIKNKFLFGVVPQVTALRCIPTIETAEANVTVELMTGKVQSFSITGETKPVADAWSEVFVPHYTVHPDESTINITTSYGVLFIRSLLAAAHLGQLISPNISTEHSIEDLHDNTFNFREPRRGLNLDLMTYAMYALAGRDPRALLNASLQTELAQHTFSTFFQNFVSSDLSLETGGWAYQPINASLTADLGRPGTYVINGTGVDVVTDKPIPTAATTVSHTNRTAIARVETSVEVLNMNPIAVWLSVSILIWLIATTIVIAALQRRYLRHLDRNIECIADVLVLVVGSEKLLQLVREKGPEALDREGKDVKTKLGWFEDASGQQRWGIEIVEEE